ncbi:hypothetical protein C7Y66_23895 [Chroococcidiopsis sp. CCALA 051]|nr:hypothetical protein C7Y66_23895 [Chroococcidiopsis sp. CCALA 051]
MGRPKRVVPPAMILTLDFGGSGLKGIVQTVDGTPQALYMEPEVSPASLSSLQEKTESNLGRAYPENIAWVGAAGEYRAVGYLAASRYNANPGLSRKKYESAFYKILAAIWVAKEKLKLPDGGSVSLALLLPPGEFEDSQLLLPMLKAALPEFITPTGTMSCSLTSYECFPEGGGIYLNYCKLFGEAIKRSVVAVISVGYRNASVLVSRRGVVDKGRTTNLGMVRLVELVMERTSGLTAESLVGAIAAAGNDMSAKHFWKLTTSSTQAARQAEVNKIIEAISKSRLEYAIALTSWLAEVLPSREELDEVIICGGTADYLKQELNDCFRATPVVWHGGVEIPPLLNEQWLGSRLADVWGLSAYHAAKVRASFAGGKTIRRQVKQEVVVQHG